MEVATFGRLGTWRLNMNGITFYTFELFFCYDVVALVVVPGCEFLSILLVMDSYNFLIGNSSGALAST